MFKSQSISVQSLSLDQNLVVSSCSGRLFRIVLCGIHKINSPYNTSAAVQAITDNGVAQMLQMHSQLMSAPSRRQKPHKGKAAKSLGNLVKSHRFAGRSTGRANSHPLTRPWIHADIRFDVVAVQLQATTNDGHVFLAHRATLELAAQAVVDSIIPGHDDHAAGIAIKSMHNPRPVVSGHITETIETILQRGRERSVVVSATRVNDHTCRFVDHDQRLVLIQDVQWHILAANCLVGHIGQANRQLVVHP